MAAMVSGPRRRDSMIDNTGRDAAFPRRVANHQRTGESGHEEPVLFLTAKDNVRDK